MARIYLGKDLKMGKVANREKEMILESLGFVFLSGGHVQLGTKYPLSCKLEGHRKNETPMHTLEVLGFWICKYCVTNSEFEMWSPQHHRPPTSTVDRQPVTDITYGEALAYIEWLSNKYELSFGLPTEPEWIFAASPFGWEYPYKKGPKPKPRLAHTYNPRNFQTLNVDDDMYGDNCFGLYHMGGNVLEMTKGWYYAEGHHSFTVDGAYYIAKGGDFGHCSFSAGAQRRVIVDIADRSPRVGFRLVHPGLHKTNEEKTQ